MRVCFSVCMHDYRRFLEIDTIKAIFGEQIPEERFAFHLYNSNLWGSTVMVALINNDVKHQEI